MEGGGQEAREGQREERNSEAQQFKKCGNAFFLHKTTTTSLRCTDFDFISVTSRKGGKKKKQPLNNVV